ncbi:MAG: flagellar biosynthesis protein FlaG [Desulfobulbaceae bacterium]|nr:flagellar biosynthesis protein FlaG [Desulfobulbaceae bacterium]
MNIQPMAFNTAETRTQMSDAAESVKRQREHFSSDKAEPAPEAENKQVHSEELLHNIKALTDNGLYSVRFEMFKDTEQLVINLIEIETGDLIRQIPSEELLSMQMALADLRGNIVETKS